MVEFEKRNPEYHLIYKIVIVGQSGVGKSQLVARFAHEDFKSTALATVGVDFKTLYHECYHPDRNSEPVRIKAQLWDTAGQERFNRLNHAYFKGAKGTFIVYDITSQESIKKLEDHIRDIKEYTDPNTVIVLLGNKIDLHSLRMVDTKEIEAFCAKHNIAHFETSARSNENVEDAIKHMINKIFVTFPEASLNTSGRHKALKPYDLNRNHPEDSVCCLSYFQNR